MSTNREFEFQPTPEEANKALRDQAFNGFKYIVDPNMTKEEFSQKAESIMAHLKNGPKTTKYSLYDLAVEAEETQDPCLLSMFRHESRHADQIRSVLLDMNIEAAPEFTIYHCPLMADMYQCGQVIGLIETNGVRDLSRAEAIEFETRLALKMLQSFDNSSGDIAIIVAVLAGRLISWFK